ncbi:hypothetical protein D6851_07075 [Altericroceibacterium spongiae]|uniref:Uncharacterized protein n=1 Tax=Altericroceibacterium spongiae TaxID=2320269 RepID=A0A420EM77_9SPHN|nr:hypothetical protein [Altericroceibacterium spongiae]RKF21778.1 hypothetical protein D6851_07075 [Altericroceibacterium spongiae]
MADTNSTPANLEDMMSAAGGPLELLRGTHLDGRIKAPMKVTDLFPGIPAEFTNRRAEARS